MFPTCDMFLTVQPEGSEGELKERIAVNLHSQTSPLTLWVQAAAVVTN